MYVFCIVLPFLNHILLFYLLCVYLWAYERGRGLRARCVIRHTAWQRGKHFWLFCICCTVCIIVSPHKLLTIVVEAFIAMSRIIFKMELLCFLYNLESVLGKYDRGDNNLISINTSTWESLMFRKKNCRTLFSKISHHSISFFEVRLWQFLSTDSWLWWWLTV